MKFSLELRELCYWCAKLVELREVRCCCMKFNVEFSDLWCWCIKLEVELSKSNVRVWSWMLSCVISDVDVWSQMFYPLWIWSRWSWTCCKETSMFEWVKSNVVIWSWMFDLKILKDESWTSMLYNIKYNVDAWSWMFHDNIEFWRGLYAISK